MDYLNRTTSFEKSRIELLARTPSSWSESLLVPQIMGSNPTGPTILQVQITQLLIGRLHIFPHVVFPGISVRVHYWSGPLRFENAFRGFLCMLSRLIRCTNLGVLILEGSTPLSFYFLKRR